MSWIDSPWRAVIAGAVTSAPLGYAAHRYKLPPFKYDTPAQAVALSALLGGLSGLAMYWGLERAIYQGLGGEKPAPKPEPEAVALAQQLIDSPFDPRAATPGFNEAQKFRCPGAYLNYWGIRAPQPSDRSTADLMMHLATWRADSQSIGERDAQEGFFRMFWSGFFQGGIWAMGRNCEQFGSYPVV